MNKHRLKSIALAAAVTVGVLASAPIHAATDEADAANAAPQPLPEPKIKVKDVINVGVNKNAAAAKSQARIDRLASQTNELLQDYKTVMKQVDGLRVYNARLERQIENQLRRLADLEEGIGEATVIQRQVTPLVLRMLDGLEKFVELDVPFHKEERINRIEQLRNIIDRSDVSIAEKFRNVLEAYKIELEYGRKVDSYKGVAEIDGKERDVNFFRVGRVALMYQTTDTEVSGAWDQDKREWVQLDSGDYRSAIQKGLRIARKQASIDILKIPVPAPEAAE